MNSVVPHESFSVCQDVKRYLSAKRIFGTAGYPCSITKSLEYALRKFAQNISAKKAMNLLGLNERLG